MMLAMLLALAAPQETQWVKIGNVGEAVMEVDPATHSLEGDLHRFRTRVSSAESGRAMVLILTINCDANEMQIIGQTELYIDGKFSEKLTPPPEVLEVGRADTDPVGSVAYDYYCKAS
jgi:hypothetical protein